LYRYDLTLPCAVTIVVKFGVISIFNFNLFTICIWACERGSDGGL
jgi:hypothetical protein